MISWENIQECINIAIQLNEAQIEKLTTALTNGDLTLQSDVLTVRSKCEIRESQSSELVRIMRRWHSSSYSVDALAIALQTGFASLIALDSKKPTVKLVWTGPAEIPNVPVRTNLSVLLELIDQSQSEIVVVGYSITEFAEVVFNHLALARSRGVSIIIIANQMEKFVTLIKRHWIENVPMPEYYTRPLSEKDKMSALHAKLTIVDQKRMLVTSANLTYHGLEGNVEIGVIIESSVAEQAVKLINQLIDHGHIIAYSGNVAK